MDTFTDQELFLLSEALLCAISTNNKAASVVTGAEVREAIRETNKKLAALNTKICNLLEECDESD